MSDNNAHEPPLDLNDAYAQLVDSVRDYAIFLLDRAGRVVSWNAGAERIKGYTASEIVGEDFSILYPEEARQRGWPQQELRLAEENGRFEDEGWRVRKDGSRFWANVVMTTLRDADGRLRGFAKITRDLTSRRQQEEALRESEERFRLLVEGVRDYAIVMLAPDGRIVSWNSGAERIHGFGAAEIVGRHYAVLYPQPAADKKWPEQELGLAREHGRFEDEGVRVRKNGSTFWAQVVITPLYDGQGKLRGYANVTRDLTDRKRIDALEKAERQTNEFLAMLAHELRNPLAPISNALHLLSRRPPADDTERWVREVLARQSAQMTRLVDDLLDVSRIARAAISLSMAPLDLRKVARAALDASMQWIDARRHTLEIELPDQQLMVLGDEARLTQVVQNLLHNATKYTPDHGRIELKAGRQAADVVISVKDNGIGMDRELLQSAFQLFRQGRQAPDRAPGGLGVGLALAQRLVAMHGGAIEAHSAGSGLGTEFLVRLPAATDTAHAAAPEPRLAVPARGRPMRILVVDDNQDAANALRLLLEHDGHDVRVASDGVAGLALAREYKPDFLLLDIGLPRLSGYDIASALRSEPEMNGTTIVAITGYGQVHDRARTAAVGFDHHLTKPVEFAALQALFAEKA